MITPYLITITTSVRSQQIDAKQFFRTKANCKQNSTLQFVRELKILGFTMGMFQHGHL